MEKHINVTRSSMPEFEEYCREISTLWDSRWLTNMGCKHQQLQEELKNYLNTPNVTLFANGHVGLEVAIDGFGLKGEVITTPYTHCSTTHSIVRNGLTPVFCDVNDRDYTIDADQIGFFRRAVRRRYAGMHDAARRQLFEDGASGGVMPLAGIAGKNQCFHISYFT